LNPRPSEYQSDALTTNLSHWANSRGAEQRLHIAALCGGLGQISTDFISFLIIVSF